MAQDHSWTPPGPEKAYRITKEFEKVQRFKSNLLTLPAALESERAGGQG